MATKKLAPIDLGTMSAEAVLDHVANHPTVLLSPEKKDYLRKVCTEGDTLTLQTFLQKRENQPIKTPSTPELGYNVSGSFVDVGLYVSGEPACMVDFTNYSPVQFINVVISVGRPYYLTDEAVIKYYGRILDVIDRLERNGTRCKIDLVVDAIGLGKRDGKKPAKYKKGQQITVRIPFKEAHQPLNMALFAGRVLNNDFLSNVLFQIDGGLFGCQCGDRDLNTLNQTETEIFFPSMYYQRFYTMPPPTTSDFLNAIGLGHYNGLR